MYDLLISHLGYAFTAKPFQNKIKIVGAEGEDSRPGKEALL